MMRDDDAVRADAAEGRLWIETPQTRHATTALHRLLDVARSEDPGWQPVWVLCGPPGTGKSAVARRFAAQARRAIACDAVAEAERRYRDELEHPRLPTPRAFRRRDAQWATYRAAMDAERRTRGFGHCPGACRPAEYLPEATYQDALWRAREAHPVAEARMGPGKPPFGVLTGSFWSSPGNVTGDPLRRTSMALVDDAERLVRLPRAKRAQELDDMVEWPRSLFLRHHVSLVLVGSPALAAAVAECRAVRLVELPPMPPDDGTFAAVCGMVFGDVSPDDVARLHATSGGAMGPLLTIAHLRGLRPPYAIRGDAVLRLPAPDRA